MDVRFNKRTDEQLFAGIIGIAVDFWIGIHGADVTKKPLFAADTPQAGLIVKAGVDDLHENLALVFDAAEKCVANRCTEHGIYRDDAREQVACRNTNGHRD
ncbi:hypothetical protein GCM10007895_29900 [Paraferrimonas sedimenticola]|uniref:Uncharacterized protein n=1 Tax=Paraferrimonas sedimenticola TaxID=375674 RepID=A0AA37RYG4_9GAMM|nr:hypothetical protein GCM10007895_29900 [Paraferrimonas sedimenticola]